MTNNIYIIYSQQAQKLQEMEQNYCKIPLIRKKGNSSATKKPLIPQVISRALAPKYIEVRDN
jgi:hypothetical protein